MTWNLTKPKSDLGKTIDQKIQEFGKELQKDLQIFLADRPGVKVQEWFVEYSTLETIKRFLKQELSKHKDTYRDDVIVELEDKIKKLKLALKIAYNNNADRNKELDALHYVWCDGGCVSGVHRYHNLLPLTEEMVQLAERNTKRLRSWFANNTAKMADGRYLSPKLPNKFKLLLRKLLLKLLLMLS